MESGKDQMMEDILAFSDGAATIAAPEVQVQAPVEQVVVVEQVNENPTPPPAVEQDNIVLLNDEPTVAAPQVETQVQVNEPDWNAKFTEAVGFDAETVKTKLAEYETLKQQAEQPRYNSKFAELIDKSVAKLGSPKDQAEAFKSLVDVITTDVTTMSARDAVAFKMKQDYPSRPKEDIDFLVDKKYFLGEFASDEDKREGEILLRTDADESRQFILKLQEEALADAPKKETIKAVDESKRVNEWKQAAPKILNDFNQIDFEVAKGVKMGYKVSAADKAELAKFAEQVAVNSGMSLDEASMKQVAEIVKMQYISQNLENIVSAAATKARSMTNEQWMKTVHNPSSMRAVQNVQAPATQDLGDMIEQAMFGGR